MVFKRCTSINSSLSRYFNCKNKSNAVCGCRTLNHSNYESVMILPGYPPDPNPPGRARNCRPVHWFCPDDTVCISTLVISANIYDSIIIPRDTLQLRRNFTDISRNTSGGKSFKWLSLRSKCSSLLSFENGRDVISPIWLLAKFNVRKSC